MITRTLKGRNFSMAEGGGSGRSNVAIECKQRTVQSGGVSAKLLLNSHLLTSHLCAEAWVVF